MDKSKNTSHKKTLNRDSIIGLGESSFRKNYYPELQKKIHSLELINARNRAIISTIPDLLLLCDASGRLRMCNDSVDSCNLILTKILKFVEIKTLILETALTIQKKDTLIIKEFELEFENTHYYFEARFKQSESNEILIIIRDITEQKLMFLKLQNMVERDTLTNLHNRRVFEDKMKSLQYKSVKNISLISIDINGLKFINDTLGHQIGDQIIIASSHIIYDLFGDIGLVSRVGGDEFAVITENTSEKEIEKRLTLISHRIIEYKNQTNIATLSLAFGYAFHTSGLVNMDYLFQTADNNMYQNKLLQKDSIRGTYVQTFMKALEAKDFISEGHADRLEELALLLGKKLSLHHDQLDRIVLLSKFHDIGKIGIPDKILNKPAKLTTEEWEVMRSHTSIGERIALESIEIRDIAPLISHHHERWDGTGYPSGLSTYDIPIEDRILSIVDSFDAMTNDRPYHKAISKKDAIKEIVACSNSQFDPTIVDLFLELYSSL